MYNFNQIQSFFDFDFFPPSIGLLERWEKKKRKKIKSKCYYALDHKPLIYTKTNEKCPNLQ